jgi:hypothetical protein
MTRHLAVGMLVAMLASPIHAKDTLSGTWEGETPAGASIVLNLEVKGTALTGTLARDGQSTTLSDGRVSKDTFTFKATLNGRTEAFSGELAGDEITIWLDRQGTSNAVVLRRTKRS